MSIFFPYSSTEVVTEISNMLNLNLSNLSEYQITSLTIACNLYFFIFWFIIVYFSLKIFNRIYERLF